MKLSILICSLEKRRRYLARLMRILDPQRRDDIEILSLVDRGEMSIGDKRNKLLDMAKGQYCCYVDDDDRVDDQYCKKILDAISTEPDCVGIEGIITFNGRGPKKFIHSIRYKSWYEENNIYYRNCNHLNPIKREISIQVPFLPINSGEDHDFSDRVLPLLHSEVYIEGPIYYYDYIIK